MNTDFRPTNGKAPWTNFAGNKFDNFYVNAAGRPGDPLSPVPNIGRRRGPGGDRIPTNTTYRAGGGPRPYLPPMIERSGGPGVGPQDVTGLTPRMGGPIRPISIVGDNMRTGKPTTLGSPGPTIPPRPFRLGPPEGLQSHMAFRTRGPRERYDRFDGGQDMTKTSVGSYVLGMVSVAALFFVIGYGLQKGKETA
tara:strand:+ start:922 stop:1503 length:582 start_codon:yes stop_codon:yes gene_type:complete